MSYEMLTDDEIREIEELTEKTTPDWSEEYDDDGSVWLDTSHSRIYWGDMEDTCGECHINLTFAARSRQYIPRLLALIGTLKLAHASCVARRDYIALASSTASTQQERDAAYDAVQKTWQAWQEATNGGES